jgi:hypothetical protein
MSEEDRSPYQRPEDSERIVPRLSTHQQALVKVCRLKEHIDLVPSHAETWLQNRQILLKLIERGVLETRFRMAGW